MKGTYTPTKELIHQASVDSEITESEKYNDTPFCFDVNTPTDIKVQKNLNLYRHMVEPIRKESDTSKSINEIIEVKKKHLKNVGGIKTLGTQFGYPIWVPIWVHAVIG